LEIMYDVAVIGGGLVGSAIAWGLSTAGQKVAVLDEGDVAHRAARGNFALVWVQGKGLGMPAYRDWTQRSADAWTAFADMLLVQTGIDAAYRRPGGFHLALSAAELERRAALLERIDPESGLERCEILDHDRVKGMLPGIGPGVAGASYCRLDGHCNSLRLFRALHAGMRELGVKYFPERAVDSISHAAGEFRLGTKRGELRAGKIVLAAGLGNARLAPMAGLEAPVRPQRGQIIVTEKTAPFLHYPVSTVRQTDEGGVMLGDSQEEAGLDASVGRAVISVVADRATRMFPRLASLDVVRAWAALRVMTPDGFPIYDQSITCPGAFLATCHSGVTLAANHALTLAPAIAKGELAPGTFETFSARRFDVQKAA
jgi:hydrogen cyanide synthase HcnC